jgi:hypothetical protein
MKRLSGRPEARHVYRRFRSLCVKLRQERHKAGTIFHAAPTELRIGFQPGYYKDAAPDDALNRVPS